MGSTGDSGTGDAGGDVSGDVSGDTTGDASPEGFISAAEGGP